ncbi:DUF222 domain-containing protein [Nocardioides bigeumensis]|uniref:HNH endonuclease signature motif containing protein n=1 Tax=Nocardioides bigeumensis TaxID=433657 RepID=A0ABN2XM14_9ACTN
MFELLRDLTAELSASLESGSGLCDAELVEGIRTLEEAVCVMSAAQAALAVELDRSQREAHEAAGVPAARRGQGVAAQVALARRESPHRGRRHLGLAKVVTTELPHTWAAWRAGRITEWKATLVARETACLSREDRALVDAQIASDLAALEAMGERELAAACQRVAYQVDAEAFVARRRRAESERFVSLRPAPDAMTWLTALLPVKDGVAAYAALQRRAESARAEGDPRGRGQVMADELVAAVTSVTSVTSVSSGLDPARPPDVASRPVRLNLVMTDTALLGDDDQPARLDGYGPIPAELAREIVAGACERQEKVWIRRLYTSPETGQLVAADARARLFPHAMGRFIRLRDQTCRTPWCDAPIRHIDHAQSYTSGGPTSQHNAQGLCEACSYAKEAPGWSARGPDSPLAARSPNTVETTTPTGHTYTTRPPALATIRRTPFTIDFVLAG